MMADVPPPASPSPEDRKRWALARVKRVLDDWRHYPPGTVGHRQADRDFLSALEQLIDAKIAASKEGT